jgi:hypothetical protein
VNTGLIRSVMLASASPVERPQGCAGEALAPDLVPEDLAPVCHHASVIFDDATTAALRQYARACDSLDAASDDAEVLHRSDLKSLAALNLRKALAAAGWSAPTGQRTST